MVLITSIFLNLCLCCKQEKLLQNIKYILALEPRVCTRWDMHRYAREAYKLGVRFIGGCCGFESYHIRAVCEEVCFYSKDFANHANI